MPRDYFPKQSGADNTGWNYNDLKTIDSELRASEDAKAFGLACMYLNVNKICSHKPVFLTESDFQKDLVDYCHSKLT